MNVNVLQHTLAADLAAWRLMRCSREMHRGVTLRDAGGKSVPKTGLGTPKHGKEDNKQVSTHTKGIERGKFWKQSFFSSFFKSKPIISVEKEKDVDCNLECQDSSK